MRERPLTERQRLGERRAAVQWGSATFEEPRPLHGGGRHTAIKISIVTTPVRQARTFLADPNRPPATLESLLAGSVFGMLILNALAR
jgi:hypothetical protein